MYRGRNESDTCRDLVEPAIRAAGWDVHDVVEQLHLQNPDAEHVRRMAGAGLRVADYVLTRGGVPLVVVEAKREARRPEDGIQQAIDYARRLEAPFAASTNGHGIVLHDRVAGAERHVSELPGPDEAWEAYTAWTAADEGTPIDATATAMLQVPFDRSLRAHGGATVKVPRYYQRLAVHAAIRAIGRGERRVLLLMATGTGKTFTALQLVHKLRTHAAQTRDGRPYRVLYLADRDILVSDPAQDFTQAFGDAVTRLRAANRTMSRDVYFATYQTLDRAAPDDGAPSDEGVTASTFSSFAPDFFDLVIVDECHRGSAAPDSSWRAILEYFSAATQVGLTATPKRDANVDTYEYFGEPVFSYSLRQGIEDGFLAPYRVRRAVLDVDAFGWAAAPGQRDRFGYPVPHGVYTTPDFERRVSLADRTSTMARHLTHLLADDPGARAVVFCVDSEHAHQMRLALMAADPDRTRRDPAWVARIVGSEPERDRLLAEFTDPEAGAPAVATTARLLSTGVDIEDLRYVVLCRPVGSMIEFKQIIGRGTRLYPPKGKQDFWVVDYVGASAKFSDPEFDGPPLAPPRVERVHDDGTVTEGASDDDASSDEWPDAVVRVEEPEPEFTATDGGVYEVSGRKLYVDGVAVDLVGEQVLVPDPDGGHRLVEYRTFAGGQVRTLLLGVDDLRARWSDAPLRESLLAELRSKGVELDDLVRLTRLTQADPFDVLAHVAWNLPAVSRRERVERVRVRHADRLDELAGAARTVMDTVMERYAERGPDEVTPRALTVPPLPEHGTPWELVEEFGGPAALTEWLSALTEWLYENAE